MSNKALWFHCNKEFLDDNSFDVTNVGKHLTAKEFNEAMDLPGTIVVDMRNHYESEIGHFENAICPDVGTFREELPLVVNMLNDQKDKKYSDHKGTAQKFHLFCLFHHRWCISCQFRIDPSQIFHPITSRTKPTRNRKPSIPFSSESEGSGHERSRSDQRYTEHGKIFDTKYERCRLGSQSPAITSRIHANRERVPYVPPGNIQPDVPERVVLGGLLGVVVECLQGLAEEAEVAAAVQTRRAAAADKSGHRRG
jgi:hypothetical protein